MYHEYRKKKEGKEVRDSQPKTKKKKTYSWQRNGKTLDKMPEDKKKLLEKIEDRKNEYLKPVQPLVQRTKRIIF